MTGMLDTNFVQTMLIIIRDTKAHLIPLRYLCFSYQNETFKYGG